MTIRDVAADFAYKPPTGSTGEVVSSSIVGNPGPYLAPNSFDSGPYGAALTEFTALDTILSVGGMNYFVEQGAGQGMQLVVDWVAAPVGGGTIQTQLLTSASASNASVSSALVMVDFGALPVATFFQGYRQIMPLPRSSSWQRFLSLRITTTAALTQGAYVSWLGLDVDSAVLGYADGVAIK
jgi:hypothetical protein